MKILLPTLALGLALATTADAQRRGPGNGAEGRDKPGNDVVLEGTTDPGIAWFGKWDDALAEAQRTGKPILLMSAAPQCTGVPGMW